MSVTRKPSARFSIVHKALADIEERLMDAPLNPEAVELHRAVARMNRDVLLWVTQPPSDAEKARVIEEVLDLTLRAMRAGRKSSAPLSSTAPEAPRPAPQPPPLKRPTSKRPKR